METPSKMNASSPSLTPMSPSPIGNGTNPKITKTSSRIHFLGSDNRPASEPNIPVIRKFIQDGVFPPNEDCRGGYGTAESPSEGRVFRKAKQTVSKDLRSVLEESFGVSMTPANTGTPSLLVPAADPQKSRRKSTGSDLSDVFPFGEGEEPPRTFDFFVDGWGDSGDKPQFELSHTRILEIFSNENGEITKAQFKHEAPDVVASPETCTTIKDAAGFGMMAHGIDTYKDESKVNLRSSPKGLLTNDFLSNSTVPKNAQFFVRLPVDPSYFESTEENERRVKKWLLEDHKLTDALTRGIEGYVYVLWEPKLRWAKIGFTIKRTEDRLAQLKSKCKLPNELQVVADDRKVSVLAFRRLERLIHEDLKPNRLYFNCMCKVKHREWYNISDEVALRTVQLWRDFICKHPYGMPEFNVKRSLERKWQDRIRAQPPPSEEQGPEDHEQRLRRWALLFELNAEQYIPRASHLPLQERMRNGDSKVKQEPEFDSADDAKTDMNIDRERTIEQESRSEDQTPIRSIPALYKERERSVPSTEATLDDTPLNVGSSELDLAFIDVDFKRGFYQVAAALYQSTKLLPRKKIQDDLLQFRWQLACAVLFGLFAPHAPPLLALLVWTTFLPFFVAELRGWTLVCSAQ